MSSEELIAQLSALGSETERTYERRVSAIASTTSPESLAISLRAILEGHGDPDIRYAAFYTLCTLHRNNKNYGRLDHTIEHWRQQFGERPSFTHLYLLSQIVHIADSRDIESILESAFEDSNSHSGNSGYVHLFAGAVANTLDSGNDEQQDIAMPWLDKALAAARLAVRLEPTYAKFHATLARLASLKGDHATARREISQAVDLEDSSRIDYALRLSNYESFFIRFELRQSSVKALAAVNAARTDAQDHILGLRDEILMSSKPMADSLAEAKEQISALSTRNLEFLGFFAAILSFTLGSLQIAGSYSARDARLLIVALMGALLVAFSGFAILVGTADRAARVRMAFTAFSGILFILLSYLLP